MGVYSGSFPNGFFLTYNHQQVKVITTRPYDPPRFGETMVYGTFRPDGTIQAVGRLEDLKKEFPMSKVEEFPEAILMPGLVNAHCHLDRSGFYSRYSVPTPTILSSTNWFIESLQYLSNTSVQTITHLMGNAIDRQIDLGITCLGTMNHYEGTFPLMKEKGIRGVAFTEIFSAPNKNAQTRFEIALALLEKYQDEKAL